MELKIGQTVYLKGMVLNTIPNDFEIGHGYHAEEVHVKIRSMDKIFVVDTKDVLTREQVKKEVNVPEPIVGNKYRNEAESVTCVYINEKNIVVENSEGKLNILSYEHFASQYPYETKK